MRKSLYISFLALLLISCKPTASIITSKEIAEKKGMYSAPAEDTKPIISKTDTSKKKEVLVKSDKKKTELSKKNIINDKNDNDIFADNENTSYIIKQLINSASDNLGVCYRGGGTNKSGFDCSGLMYSTFKNFDITLPRSSHEMAQIGRKLEQNEIKKGDLIFFKTNGKNRINHVGMVVEINSDEIKFIHSSTQSGVIVSSTKEPYYKRTFSQVNRVLE